MSKKIRAIYTPGGTLQVVCVRDSDDKFWNTDSGAFETYNASHISDYLISLDEIGSAGIYSGEYPAAITDPTTEYVFVQNGGAFSLTTDSPPITSGPSQGADLNAIRGSTTPAARMGTSAGTMAAGQAVAGILTVNSMTTDLTNPLPNAYAGATVIWTTGVLKDVRAKITGYTVSGGRLSYSPIPQAPAAGDSWIIV